MELYNEDCLERLKKIPDKSIDLIFNDLPYGQTSCKWDSLIDIDELWKEYKRIRKDTTPIFFTCSTKFGHSLISSNMKEFRYDLVWVKSAACGFLNAKKMPMKKHEMIYVFYKKLPLYDLSSHTHKFLKETENKRNGKDGIDNKGMIKNRSKTEISNKYDPPLPVSVIKEDTEDDKNDLCKYDVNKNTYGGGKEGRIKISKDKKDHQQKYDPPLPVSVIKEDTTTIKTDLYSDKNKKDKRELKREPPNKYDPPLPVSVIKEDDKNYKTLYGDINIPKHQSSGSRWNPPLPVSVIKEPEMRPDYDTSNSETYGNIPRPDFKRKNNESMYSPPLPNSILEIKSQKGKHSTQKPDALMEWILKYYSKENDIVLDATMGSGSMGVSCKKMNRKFIGIEKDEEIFKVAKERII